VVVMNARSNALKNLTWLFAASLPSCAVAQIPEGWEIIEIFPAGTEYICGPPDINDNGGLIPLADDDLAERFPRTNTHGTMSGRWAATSFLSNGRHSPDYHRRMKKTSLRVLIGLATYRMCR
jgi:hypothetical protein